MILENLEVVGSRVLKSFQKEVLNWFIWRIPQSEMHIWLDHELTLINASEQSRAEGRAAFHSVCGTIIRE